jgi:CxxC motif-containing protein (DUF1111 family)
MRAPMKLATGTPAVAIVVLAMNFGACGDGAPSGANRAGATSGGGDPGSGGQSGKAPMGGSPGMGGAGRPGTGGSGGNGPGTGGTSGGGSSGTAADGGLPTADAGPADGSPGTGGDAKPPGADGGPSRSDIVPLFDATTTLEREVLFDRGDAIVTRFGDRGRDRHAREDEFQSYDHYLPHYWEYRTSRYIFVDKVAKGGGTIDVSWVSEWKLDPLPEFRAWYSGQGTVAQYHGNYAPRFKTEGPGTYDEDHNRVGDGVQYKFTYTITGAINLDGKAAPLAIGQFMEIEISQFLDAVPVGRDNYYGTVFLYEVGRGGMVPWYTVGTFADKSSERENSHKLDEKGWLGGRTTLPYAYSDEPDNHFMQMATNLADRNAQPFVRGRRVHHTHMTDGTHDEGAENGTFDALKGIAGPNYVNVSCDSCHKRNGRAPVADIGVPLDKWVFKVAAADGGKDPLIGSVLQPSGSPGEGTVSIARWVTNAEGLRSPEYAFSKQKPALFSARIAPPLVGLGLLEAVHESTILALQDVNDANGDGISGKIQISIDPITGVKRLGRFGWKGGASSLRHQIAGALNNDMGVMTSVMPKPDCGTMQQGCGNDQGAELADAHLDDLVKYVQLLGVRARRNLNDAETLRGEAVFNQLSCPSCHVADLKTSKFHPLAELRDQTIHPYTDLLLHDMGPGLADNLGEGQASGAEWRTTALWGLGLSACVVGGVTGPAQEQVCTPHHDYLHDGRARTIAEAILWHDGEGRKSKDAYVALPATDKTALVKFLESL